MQLAGETADIACVVQQARDEHLIFGDVLPVLPCTAGARVTPGQKRRTARGAYRVLTVGAGKADALRRQLVQMRRADIRVAVAAERVKALLIRAQPQNIRSVVAHADSPLPSFLFAV